MDAGLSSNDYESAWVKYKKFLELDQGKTDKQAFQAGERAKALKEKIKRRQSVS